MESDNHVKIIMDAKSQNEAFARMTVAAFASQLDPTLDELMDIKTVVSEAVTNAIIHGYENKPGEITICCDIIDDNFIVDISDNGVGIEDIPAAMQPLYTSKPELDRSGMGFTIMESFMDNITVTSRKGQGVRVLMEKRISRH